MKTISRAGFLLIAFFAFTGGALAGEVPKYTFTLRGWEFKLTSYGHPDTSEIHCVLKARHLKTDIGGSVEIDHRWYALADQYEAKDPRLTAYFETLVAFSGREWEKGYHGKEVLKLMKENPPTEAWKAFPEYLAKDPWSGESGRAPAEGKNPEATKPEAE